MRDDEDEDWVELEGCYVKAATPKAVLVTHGDEEFWVPRSMIQDGDELEKNEVDVTVVVREWFARKEGLI